ncbi:MAG: hypothetical protein NTY60_01595 [Proteobacteria bacterium]|nr:hypothetical protein [Pseudomonadota bacterium]
MIILIMLLATSAYASELEIISLKHRSAGELIPIIRPLLNQDEMVSGMDYQLILRASPRNIAQIRRLLDDIDTVPRRLKITVMQDVDSETVARLTEVSGSIGVGKNARVTFSGGTGPAQDKLNVRIISTRSLEDDRKTQQLQVLEGNRARITSGQSVPVLQRQVVQTAWGAQVIETTQYKDLASGFYVLPRVNGDNVTLEISTENDSLAPNQTSYPATRIQNTSSMLSGHLGEWMVVGGLGQQNNTDNSTITTRSTSRSNEQRNVLIKVEEVN